MSRLVNIGVGEVCDRLSILALKILHGGAAGKETTHWQTEQTALFVQIRSRDLTGRWFAAYAELAAVNAALWTAEDTVRELRQQAAVWKTPDSSGLTGEEERKRIGMQAASVAFWVQELNDRRAELVDQINKEAGEFVGPEKGR